MDEETQQGRCGVCGWPRRTGEAFQSLVEWTRGQRVDPRIFLAWLETARAARRCMCDPDEVGEVEAAAP